MSLLAPAVLGPLRRNLFPTSCSAAWPRMAACIYLPTEYPQVTGEELNGWRKLSYADLAFEVLKNTRR